MLMMQFIPNVFEQMLEDQVSWNLSVIVIFIQMAVSIDKKI